MPKDVFYNKEIYAGKQHIKALRDFFKKREEKQEEDLRKNCRMHQEMGKEFHRFMGNDISSENPVYPVVSIVGPRGAGKTTLLYQILGELKQNNTNDLILPVVNPNQFADNDHPLLWIMAVLKGVTKDLDKWKTKHDRDSKLWKDYISLYRQIILYIMNTKKGVSSLYDKSSNFEESTEQLLVDGYDIFASGYSLDFKLNQFIKDLTEAYKTYTNNRSDDLPMMIVAIDDIDINIDHFPDILDFISTCLGDLNRLICLVCADYRTIAGITEEKILSRFKKSLKVEKKIESVLELSKKLSEQFMLKYFPSHRRIILKEMNYDERAKFIPLLEYSSSPYPKLKEIMQDIILAPKDSDTGPFPLQTLWQYFCYRDEHNDFDLQLPYLDILSGNPRTLEALYHHIYDWHKTSSNDGDKAALFELFHGMWKITIDEIPSMQNGIRMDDIVTWDRNKNGIFLTNTDRFEIVWNPLYPYITINKVWKNPLYIFDSSFFVRDKTKNSILPERFSMWFFFLHEFVPYVGIPLNSGVFPGISFEYEDRYTRYPLVQPSDIIPVPSLSTPWDWFLSVEYYKKFHPIMNNYLRSIGRSHDGTYDIEKDHEPMILKIMCYQLFCWASIIIKRSVDKQAIVKIWSSNKNKKYINLVNDLVGSLEKIYGKSSQNFISQAIFNNWNREFQIYMEPNGGFERSIIEKYLKGSLRESVKYAVDKFMSIPDKASS